MRIDWTLYPNFSAHEFRCKHTGKNEMNPEFLARLQALRTEFGKPMKISSGFRHPTHPIEASKKTPGTHSTGRAADILVSGTDAFIIVALAYKHGFTGIGIQQKGGTRFIHLDDLSPESKFFRETIWSY